MWFRQETGDKMKRRTFALAMIAGILRAQRTPGDGPNRMHARALAPVETPAPAGLHQLKVRNRRDTLVYIPESASKFPKAPLVLSLHGATQDADRGISLLQTQADQHGFVIVAPASIETTWEIEGAWGEDFDNVDRSLALAFDLRNIDPARISIAGFSDGASYSLSLGLSNGDLFHAVMAFSSGYLANGARVGKPPVFLSHGTGDQMFPIDATGRNVARTLKRDGYDVTFREFDGPHRLPPDVAAEAMRWLMAAKPLAA
jgi:predicted esterase